MTNDLRFGASRAALIVTTINSPTPAMVALAEGAREREIDFFVIGDKKGPTDFSLEGVTFRSYQDQLASEFEFASGCPAGHYARKNVGYLDAVASGAEVIVETDDDNLPRPEFFEPRSLEVQGEVFRDAGWVNTYRAYSTGSVWPRGFPLRHVLAPSPTADETAAVACPIQQGLADGDPDVDAIYRLVGEMPVHFSEGPPVVLASGSWCPFNSQNTTWFPEAFPLLYLPVYCSWRTTDIWRSFVAQRILGANGWGLAFHQATVWHDRNEHDLLRDFEEEIPGYLNNEEIVARLSGLDIPADHARLFDAVELCYTELVSMGMVGAEELPLLAAFRRDFEAVR